MKQTPKIILIAILSILGIVSCFSIKNQNLDYLPNYSENRLSFYDPSSSPFPDSNFTYIDWIRKEDNIITAHETFKKVGYQHLIDYNYFEDWDSEKIPLKQRIDSLVQTFRQDSVGSKYYREFWNRRKQELNDSIVFEVLKEINSIIHGQKINYDSKFVNDTLSRLLEITFSEDSLNLKTALSNFEYLKSIGFHQSAYNILKERYAYYQIDWNVNELEKTLIRDTNNSCYVPWIQDDTK